MMSVSIEIDISFPLLEKWDLRQADPFSLNTKDKLYNLLDCDSYYNKDSLTGE